MNLAEPPTGASANETFREVVEGARAKLKGAIDLAGLRDDPYGRVLAALDHLLGVLSDHVDRIDAAIDQIRKPFTQDVLSPIQRAAAAGSAQEVLRIARTVRWRTMILAGAGIGLAAVITAVGGYSWGRASAAASFRATEANLAAAFRDGPQAAAEWLDLMRWNAIGTALAHCQAFADQATGRQACMVPLWTAPPKSRIPGT